MEVVNGSDVTTLPVIGYSARGDLIRGRYLDARGSWLEPVDSGDVCVVRMANVLDQRVLGATAADPVIVVRQPGEEPRRYLARSTTLLAVPADVAKDEKLLDGFLRQRATRQSGDDERE